MAISHDSEWAKQADEATKRREALNIPWDVAIEQAIDNLGKALEKMGYKKEFVQLEPTEFDVV